MAAKPTTVDEYLAALPDDRREALSQIREEILANLPDGVEESMSFGMPTYEVPLERSGPTYNGKPLMYAALASQKRYMAAYLTCAYLDESDRQWIESRFAEADKKLDMGKSCLRFRSLDDLPDGVIGEAVGRKSVDEFVRAHERS
ncbi:DUF1801 domain-containing protein [Thermoleophilia bacterium SCSIO 60948]|nr:DUF1801 domain-containing protein [Thermoleophilia bacterium SCSIO 60948]